MALTLQQTFLTGRFHATRWNQSPFEDHHGEWPPSPYRLLRALAARWFQYARETGDRSTALRDTLLRDLAAQLPAFQLPETATHSATWPSRGIKQYLPTELVKSDKAAGQPWMLRAQTTLFVDTFATLPNAAPVFWSWPGLNLQASALSLLDALLARVTYFGRAESLCLIHRLADSSAVPEFNCQLTNDGTGSPVLAADPAAPFNIDLLLAHNDDARLRGRRIPPGTRWFNAQRPRPSVRRAPSTVRRIHSPVQTIQFAVGGRVFPPKNSWIGLTEKFRGAVLSELRHLLFRQHAARGLSEGQLDETRLMAGKSGDGTPLTDHSHPWFWLLPDEAGRPTRLVCHRGTPFTSEEQEALLRASEHPIAWQHDSPDWTLRLVPLPHETPLPSRYNVFGSSKTWTSVTPFIPPRHVTGRGGKPKPGESVEEQIVRELEEHRGFLKPEHIRVSDGGWVKAHQAQRGPSAPSNRDKRGYEVTVHFPGVVHGPIALGNSCHFGLGLFAPMDSR